MKLKKDKLFNIVVGVLVLLEVIFVHLTFKSLENKPTELYDVKLRDEVNKDNNGFAILVGDKEGVYTESTSNEWPNNLIYLYNSEKSGCIDNSGEKVEGALSFDSVTNTATITTNKTVNCYMYFDIDTTSPTISVTVSDNNTVNPKITITSNESGTYCVNTSNVAETMTNCLFSGNITANTQITTDVFTGTGTYYVHIKDNAGNVGMSNLVSISVLLYDKILDLSPAGLQKSYSVTSDDLYRFIGNQGNTGINNYICLGTDTCTSGDDNMYRIIGINPETNEIKVIKETRLGFTADDGTVTNIFQWHNTDGVTWEQSGLYNTLNTTWLESISFADLIVTKVWNMGDVVMTSDTEGDHVSKASVIEAEKKAQTTNTAKVGVLSMTDYYLAYTEDRNWRVDYDTTNWMHYSNNNWSTWAHEWTMSRYSSPSAWLVTPDGIVGKNNSLAHSHAIRPTFFLTPELQYVSGTGEVGSPFIVSMGA